MSADSPSGRLMKETALIVWDEAPMQHRHAFEAVDHKLQSLMDTPLTPFGGKVAGDFRQILPVVHGGDARQIIDACIQKSRVWPFFRTVRLRENMPVKTAMVPHAGAEMTAFTELLLEIGEGRHYEDKSVGNDYCRLPKDMFLGEPPVDRGISSQLISHVYGDVVDRYEEPSYFAERAILALWNVDVDDMNNKVLEMLPVKTAEDEYVYLSQDSVAESEYSDVGTSYPTEFLNTLSFGGIPPHKLHLKVGAIVMLLRNLQGDRGLCNGTRLQICRLKPTLIDAMILNGRGTGNRVIIPRLELTSSDSELLFQLTRRQLPLNLAFAMTIHKTQGRTVPCTDLFLPRPIFAHGQLYVALSRVSSQARIEIAIQDPVKEDEDETFVKNIVYGEIIQGHLGPSET